jgi:hypothetical protein
MEVEWQTAGLPVLKSGFESRHPLRPPAGLGMFAGEILEGIGLS